MTFENLRSIGLPFGSAKRVKDAIDGLALVGIGGGLAAAAPPLGAVAEGGVDACLWLKGCLILDACTKGTKSFVSSILERLHCRVLDEVKDGIVHDLGVCEVEDFFLNWNCSTCKEADKPEFTENAPVTMYIRALDANGVAYCGTSQKNEIPHHLPPNRLSFCYIKNIPSGLFPDANAISPNEPLLLCRNPDDPAESKEFMSSKLIFLRSTPLIEPLLIPFSVQLCRTSEEGPTFHAVLCYSIPGLTKPLVDSFRANKPVPALGDRKCDFGFWTLNLKESQFYEQMHSFKPGDLVRFIGDNLPNGIMSEHRYFVAETTKYCFNICGSIVYPASPWTSDISAPNQPSLVVTRRSPISRSDNAMLLTSVSECVLCSTVILYSTNFIFTQHI